MKQENKKFVKNMIPLLPEEYFEHELCVPCVLIHIMFMLLLIKPLSCVIHVSVNMVHGKSMRQNLKKNGQVILMSSPRQEYVINDPSIL